MYTNQSILQCQLKSVIELGNKVLNWWLKRLSAGIPFTLHPTLAFFFSLLLCEDALLHS